jgi:hypothetical protein
VAFVESQFIGTGYDLTSVATSSSNGDLWLKGTASIDNVPAAGQGTIVAFNALTPLTSPDGINWTTRPELPGPTTSGFPTPGTPGNAYSVPVAQSLSFLNGKFYAFLGTKVASTGSVTNARVFCSTNGIDWTRGNITGLAFVDPWGGNVSKVDLCEVRGAANSTSMSVAVGRGVYGNLANSPVATNKCIRSADQVNWVGTTLPFAALWNGIAFGQGRFVAVCDGAYAVSSTDGLNWVTIRMPATLNWTSITFANGVWVAVGGPSSIAATSKDGLNWTKVTLPVSATWTSVSYGNGRFLMTSTTGVSLYSAG